MQELKSAILGIFQTGLGWPCTVVRPSRIPHRILKILFALGADEFLAMLEGKIRVTPFFTVQSGKIPACNVIIDIFTYCICEFIESFFL